MSERTFAPRSGGRTAEQGATGTRRRYPTQGTAALAPVEPLGTGTTPAAPRLRVAPPAPVSAPRAPFIAVVIAIVVAGVFGVLLINTKTNENTFELSRLQDRQAALDNQQQRLENQIAGYESTGNLDAAARRLGLVKADTPAYIRLPDGKIIGVPRPGMGRPAVTAQDPVTAKPADSTAAKADPSGPESAAATAGASAPESAVAGGPAQNAG
jgi:type II secretory pathway pseudopilin PulG